MKIGGPTRPVIKRRVWLVVDAPPSPNGCRRLHVRSEVNSPRQLFRRHLSPGGAERADRAEDSHRFFADSMRILCGFFADSYATDLEIPVIFMS